MITAINQEDWKKIAAEIVGTFFFFFIGIGSIVAAQGMGPTGLVIVALAHGLALSVAISSLGHVSGAHFNPAVTLGLMTARRINPILALLYIAGQIIGGVGACLALVAVLPQQVWQAFNLGTPSVAKGYTTLEALVLEAILTFFLVLAVFGTAVDTRAARIGGFGIGLTVFVDILVGGNITGGVMNPARAITPAIVSGAWNGDWWIYWVGPIVGAVLAALLYSSIFLPRGDEPVAVVATTSGAPVEPPFSEPNLTK